MNHSNRFLRKIYLSSPYYLKLVIASYYGALQRSKRYGDYFHNYFASLRESQFIDNASLMEKCSNMAIDFSIYAKKNIPYYRLFPDIYNITDLKKYPILKKDNVQDNIGSLCYPSLRLLPHIITHTSGTTGTALVFPLTNECYQREYAFRALHYEWGGVNLIGKEPIATAAGHPVTFFDRNTPPYWVKDFANNWLLLSSYHMKLENLKYYIKTLENFSPKLIHGYPSSLYLLALANRKYGQGLIKPKAIFSSSETLFDFQRSVIENSFQCKVFNWYGNSEMTANIVECEKGELHLKLEHSFVEIINDEQRECKPGELGRLICTNYGNAAFPLIRYDVGDSVTISNDQKSKCGRSGIMIDRIEGRDEDYIITPDRRLVGRLDHIFKNATNILEAQIEQFCLEEILFNIVKNNSYTKRDEEIILYEAKIRLGSEIKIKFNYVKNIRRSANGKFRFIYSHIKKNDYLSSISDSILL